MRVWVKFAGAIVVLFALDAVLIFVPAFAPIPRERSKSATQSSDNGRSNGKYKENPAPPFPLVNGVVQSVAAHPHGGDVRAHNIQQQEAAVATRSPLQIAIVKSYPTILQYIYDWGPWAFALALVIVGVQQVKLLRLTLNRVSRQADVANRQAVIMARQVKEMRKISEIENRTLILQYRPRVSVRNILAKNFSTDSGADGECRISFQIVIDPAMKNCYAA